MYIKSASALVAALVIGTSSAALAYTQFDVNIYHPTVQGNGLNAFAQQLPAQKRIAPSHDAFRARAQDRAPALGIGPLNNGGGGVCMPIYDSAGVQKAPYCHHYSTNSN